MKVYNDKKLILELLIYDYTFFIFSVIIYFRIQVSPTNIFLFYCTTFLKSKGYWLILSKSNYSRTKDNHVE